jgi:hypothetical protein
MKKTFNLCVLLLIFLSLISYTAYGIDDGTYDATVTTKSGTYSVPVEVEDGEVTTVHWPNGGNMRVNGADIEDGEASGYNSRGDSVDIEIDE